MTWRNLLAMYKARVRYDWNHTSSIIWIIHEVNRDPKRGRKKKPDDFHPMGSGETKPEKPGIFASRDEFMKLKRFVHAGRFPSPN